MRFKNAVAHQDALVILSADRETAKSIGAAGTWKDVFTHAQRPRSFPPYRFSFCAEEIEEVVLHSVDRFGLRDIALQPDRVEVLENQE